jgi:predicted dehydrogenase
VKGSALGVAVVGNGYWGANLSRNFALAPGWDLLWVCDADDERAGAGAAAFGARATDRFDRVLADRRIDAIALATPRRPMPNCRSRHWRRESTCWSRSRSLPPSRRPS